MEDLTLYLKHKLDDRTEKLMSMIIGAAIEVHRGLGPGFLEKVYENALSVEFRLRNIPHLLQTPVTVTYKGQKVQGQVLDMIVDNRVIIELKAVEKINSVHEAQLLSYLKSTGINAGLLINFREKLVKDGIKRFVRSKLPYTK
ncbi:MAG: hypothetical protein K940chlam3_00295 [Chlamydiae bacterium]|nr:hypothetical protein [Chlamydiota bacterium]